MPMGKVANVKRPTWSKSEQRERLRKDLASGKVSTDVKATKPKDVFRQEYDFDGNYNRFSSRLRSLQKIVAKGQQLAADDFALLQATMEGKETSPKTGSNGKPRWEGSAAEMFLRVAVADGLVVGNKPSELRALNPVYKLFSGKVFRDHIYQEKKTQKYVKSKFPKSHQKMIDAARIYINNYEEASEDEE